jgi:hypothetical protein
MKHSRELRNSRCAIAVLALAPSAALGCHVRHEASLATFTAATRDYLKKRGDLCVARPVWPVDVSAHDAAVGSRDAVQMPVLERLGLVDSRPAPGDRDGRRYRLTGRGRVHYLDRATREPVSPDEPGIAAHADFCPVSLALERVVSWQVHDGGATVNYTYQVTAPDWAQDPAFQRVFPAVGRVVQGAGRAQLTQELTLTPAGWIANDLLPVNIR